MLKSLIGVGSRAAAVAKPQGALWPSVRPAVPPCSRAMSSSGQGSVHDHSGTSVPADADVKAAQEGEPQFHGSGEPLDVDSGREMGSVREMGLDVGKDPKVPDPVLQDPDVKATQKGMPEFEGSGQPSDTNTVPTRSGKV